MSNVSQLAGQRNPFQARPYQAVAVQSVMDRVAAGRRRLLLHLPTGAGKTVIATLILQELRTRRPGVKVLFVSHRREIVDQTARTLRRQMPTAVVAVEQGERRADGDADIVVASVQSLVKRKEAWAPEEFGVIICDECHRALAPSWADVLRYFGDGLSRDGLLLGLTATPRRSDGRSALEVFEEVAYEIDRVSLQELGYLTPMRYFTAQADLGLAQVKRSAGDFQVGSLSRVMNSPRIRGLTLSAWRQRAWGLKTLVFCAGVEHAEQLAADFAATYRIRTASVSGRTPNRTEILDDFRAGRIDLLTNYGVLTEGYDEPTIQCVVMARPTTSPLVYTQCVGRGLRPAEDKPSCTVIDIVDRTATPLQYGVGHLASLPAGWRCKGGDPFRDQQALAGVRVTDPDAFVRVQAARSLEAVHAVLLELPPEVVTAGLGGGAVLDYEVPDSSPDDLLAESVVRTLLSQAGARVKRVAVDSEQVRIQLASPELDNERFAWAVWHLERATGREIRFEQPAEKPAVRPSASRSFLRSLLRPGLTLAALDVDVDGAMARATVAGLRSDEGAWLQETFARETGLRLELDGQMALPF